METDTVLKLMRIIIKILHALIFNDTHKSLSGLRTLEDEVNRLEMYENLGNDD